MKHNIILSLLLTAVMYISIVAGLNSSLTTANSNNTRKPAPDLMTARALSREPTVLKYGIDVSKNQGEIDWERVAKTRTEFVMMRAAVGAVNDAPISADSRFDEYIEGAQNAGLDVGVYFFSYAETISEIVEEAWFLVDLLKDYRITYTVVLDMEQQPSEYKDNPVRMAEAFLEIITDAGYFPMFYSYQWWLEHFITPEFYDKYAIWVAHYDVHATTYSGDYYMWQYTERGKVSGITDNNQYDYEKFVDLNISYRDFAGYIRKHGLNGLR